jgi:hypothetical protein
VFSLGEKEAAAGSTATTDDGKGGRRYRKDRAEEEHRIVNNTKHLLTAEATGQDEVVGKTGFDFFPQEMAARYLADEQEIGRSGRPLALDDQGTCAG